MIKIQTLLNSPWGVSGLVIAATATIYINVIQPMQGQYYDASTDSETALNDSTELIDTSSVTRTSDQINTRVALDDLVLLQHPLRDPFKPALHKKNKHYSPPVLSAIVAGSGVRLAILNGEVAETGNKIGAYTVTHIEQQSVSLAGPHGKTTLTLQGHRK